jgi:hypothetical protein
LDWGCVLVSFAAFVAFVVHDFHAFPENLFLFLLSFPLVSQACFGGDDFGIITVFVPPLSCPHR